MMRGDRSVEVRPDLYKRIEQFVYDPDQGLTFTDWIGRFEEAVQSVGGSSMNDSEKRATLTRKLQQNEYTLLKGSILPRTLDSLNFEETKDWLEKLFGDKKKYSSKTV